jgi:HTH-type transcriptional regulator, sugar sensing transcriptional regulator
MAEPLAPDTMVTLRRLGMTEYGARAYHALLLLGRSDGAGVAKAAGIPPTRVHSVLRDLHEKGFVTVESGRPAMYVPKRPRERLAVDWAQAERQYERAVSDLELAYAGRSIAASTPIWFIRGEQAIAQRFRELAVSARHQLAIVLPFLLSTDLVEFFPALVKAARGGCRVRILVSPDLRVDPRKKPWAGLLQAGVELRATLVPMRLTIADFETAIILPPAPARERMVAVWNPLQEFVQLLGPAFELMWEKGQALVPHGRTVPSVRGRRG